MKEERKRKNRDGIYNRVNVFENWEDCSQRQPEKLGNEGRGL